MGACVGGGKGGRGGRCVPRRWMDACDPCHHPAPHTPSAACVCPPPTTTTRPPPPPTHCRPRRAPRASITPRSARREASTSSAAAFSAWCVCAWVGGECVRGRGGGERRCVGGVLLCVCGVCGGAPRSLQVKSRAHPTSPAARTNTHAQHVPPSPALPAAPLPSSPPAHPAAPLPAPHLHSQQPPLGSQPAALQVPPI